MSAYEAPLHIGKQGPGADRSRECRSLHGFHGGDGYYGERQMENDAGPRQGCGPFAIGCAFRKASIRRRGTTP